MSRIERCLIVLCMGLLLLPGVAGAQTGIPAAPLAQAAEGQAELARQFDAMQTTLVQIKNRQNEYQQQLGLALGVAIVLLVLLCVIVLRQPLAASSNGDGQARFLTPRYIREMTLFRIQLAGIRRRQDKLRLFLADAAYQLSARKEASDHLRETLDQLLQEARRLDDRIESFCPTGSNRMPNSV